MNDLGPGKYEKKECARCGKLISCLYDHRCWCSSIDIPQKVRDYMSATYDGCLCEDCLRELIEQMKDE